MPQNLKIMSADLTLAILVHLEMPMLFTLNPIVLAVPLTLTIKIERLWMLELLSGLRIFMI
jgi:hypothetical protein